MINTSLVEYWPRVTIKMWKSQKKTTGSNNYLRTADTKKLLELYGDRRTSPTVNEQFGEHMAIYHGIPPFRGGAPNLAWGVAVPVTTETELNFCQVASELPIGKAGKCEEWKKSWVWRVKSTPSNQTDTWSCLGLRSLYEFGRTLWRTSHLGWV